MEKIALERLWHEYKERRQLSLPDHLCPAPKGFRLLPWAQELFSYYHEHGIIVRPFDDLPPLRLSQEAGIATTIQDVHRFILSDINLVPLAIRRAVLQHACDQASAQEAWQPIASLLMEYLKDMDQEAIHEELSWKFSPVAEILWALTWFFMDREKIAAPLSVLFCSSRFPYYLWLDAEGKQTFWEPDHPLCRWEWLALDLYRRLYSTTA